MVAKNKRNNFCCILTLFLWRSLLLVMGHKVHLSDYFYLVAFAYLIPLLKGYFGLTKCMFLTKKFIFLTTVAMGTRKGTFFSSYFKVC